MRGRQRNRIVEGRPPREPTAVGTLADLPVGGTAAAEVAGTPLEGSPALTPLPEYIVTFDGGTILISA